MGICMGWSCARRGTEKASSRAPNARTAEAFALELRFESGAEAPHSILIVVMMLLGVGWILWCGNGLVLLELDDFVVLVVGENANERHHAHHFGGPVGGETVRFWFCHDGVHAHFHERVLWKAFCVFGVVSDWRMVDMLEADRFRERHHLAQSLWISLRRRCDLTIAKQIHHAVHHVMGKMAVDHPRAGIFRVEFDDTRLRDA